MARGVSEYIMLIYNEPGSGEERNFIVPRKIDFDKEDARSYSHLVDKDGNLKIGWTTEGLYLRVTASELESLKRYNIGDTEFLRPEEWVACPVRFKD